MPEIYPLNQTLGDRLGRGPLGEPIYKWFHSEAWFHRMRTGQESVQTPGGIWHVAPVFEKRKMVTLNNTWILGHYHAAESRHEWESKYGTKLLWPKDGYYTPTNITMAEGEFPSLDTNDKIIASIRRHRDKTLADHVADGEGILARKEKREESLRSDIIDDTCTAFGNDPGKRNGNVSFGGISTP